MSNQHRLYVTNELVGLNLGESTWAELTSEQVIDPFKSYLSYSPNFY